MSPPLGPIWDFFLPGPSRNTSHNDAYCLGCIRHHRQVPNPPNDTDTAFKKQLTWAIASAGKTACVNGVKSSMIAHLIGAKPCPRASDRARKKATELKKGKKRAKESDAESDADNESDSAPPSKKLKKVFRNVEKAMRQPELQVWRGANIPFSTAEVERVREQFLRATVSANLPFRWIEDIEVIKLLLMFRSTACDVIPSREVIAGSLLNSASAEVEKKLRAALKGQYVVLSTDGWKDDSHNPITGVNVSTKSNSYLVDLIQSNGHKKDGASMCLAFEQMIDKNETTYGCIVVLFCCDNDGGSQRGRKDLALKRPWLIIVPCCAHQGQLILGDYFAENEDAAETAEQATELVHWIISHDRVRKIFDDAQHEKNFKVLVYLLANITRWTTHYLAFCRLLELKVPLRHAAYLRRQDIIDAQLGAEKNKKAINKITATANKQCDLIENNDFWSSLQTVVDDIEPICYATNINQGDRTRPDQVLLSFAGLFRHFSSHTNRSVSKGMIARIEKRWAALDQPMFILCLVLNPYEGLERFGDKAGINVFVLNTELLTLFRRVRARPRSRPRPVGDDERREKEVSTAFMQYLSGTGPFAPWEANKEMFQQQHPDDPQLVWENLKSSDGVADLARFAIMLLGLTVNQAPNERSFSDLKIKKTRLRNRLGTKKLEKMSKIGADIRSENLAAGLIHERAAREVHDPTKVAGLLSVPRYADALEADDDEGDGAHPSRLVKTAVSWRVQVNRWVKAAQENEDSGSDGEQPEPQGSASRPAKFFPRSLAFLFGGKVANPVGKPRPAQFTREVLLMELLAAEESDEEPDDGAMSGSGDDFEI
ncbi:ribonuclease H-like domain-containing protein [Mycena epipterygia]|nr:ribonuclease H-like domain-containing protein [Mycena epipterygia]